MQPSDARGKVKAGTTPAAFHLNRNIAPASN